MTTLLTRFLSEARGLLDQASGALLALEKTPGDAEVLNTLFRSMHTLKGSSGVVDGLEPLTRVVHAGEDVLDACRSGRLTFSANLADHLFDVVDLVGDWLAALEEDGILPPDARRLQATVTTSLRDLMPADGADGNGGGASAAGGGAGARGAGAPGAGGADDAPCPWLAEVEDADRRAVYALVVGGGGASDAPPNGARSSDAGASATAARASAASPPAPSLVAFDYRPDPQCFFTGDDPFLTARTVPGLVWRRVEPVAPWAGDLATFDPFACALRFRGLSTAGMDAVAAHLAYVLEQVTLHPVLPSALILPTDPSGDPGMFKPFSDDARAQAEACDWRGLAQAVAAMRGLAGDRGLENQALAWLDLLLAHPPVDGVQVRRMVEAIATGRLPPAPGPAEAAKTPATGATKGAGPGGEAVGSGRPFPPAPAPAPTPAPAPAPTPAPASTPAPAPAPAPATTLAGAAAAILAAQLEAMTQPMDQAERLCHLPSRKETVGRVLIALGDRLAAEKLDAIVCDSRRVEDEAFLIALVRDLLADLGASSGDPAAETGAVGADPDLPRPTAAAVTAAALRQPAPGAGAPGAEAAAERGDRRGRSTKTRIREIKVDQERIDHLMDLAGELVVAKNALPFLARRAERDFGVRELAQEIKAQHQTVNRIVEDLQGAVMQVRMVPVAAAFGAFPRLVRDFARKLDKRIRLVVVGEDTEADKTVVEDLSDPLVHLIRNSIDHGLEPPDERRAAGKPEEGIIELRASQQEDRVVIEVSDDGRGIDPEKIKAKALEKGLITAEAAADLDRAAALNLIFAAGFSTAEAISDLSGRGVGMDVVRVAVEKAGGTITLHSTPGEGTRVRLSLPLAMSVNRVMIVTQGGQPFGVAMDQVVETVRIRREAIHKIKGREATVLRNRVVPLVRLGEVLGIVPAIDLWDSGTGLAEEAVLVLNDGKSFVGLIVDDFEGNVEVIQKPMEGVLARFTQYAGTAVLGDGRVLLVLNIREILSWS